MVTGMWKLTMREIRKSLGRFLAIAAIVALGVGFFCGLRLTKTAMVYTLDDYAETHQMYDFRLMSTIGYDTDAASVLETDSRIAAAEGGKSADALVIIGDGAAQVCKFLSVPQKIDLPGLTCGRMPESADECLADGMLYGEKDLGRTVTIADTNEQDDLDNFAVREFTIVGVARSILYINYERGTTSVGSGTVASFFYVLPAAFDMDYDTEVCLRLTDRAGAVYSEEYDARIDAAEPWVTELAESLAAARGDRLREDAEQELSDARETLDEKQQELSDAKQKLADAQQELRDAEQDVADGEKKLADAKEDTARELADAYQKLTDGQKEIEENEKKLADARTELEDAERQFADGEAEYNDGARQLEEGKQELRDTFNDTIAELQAGQAEIDKNQAALNEQRAQLDAQKTQLTAQRAELTATRAQVEAAAAAGLLPAEEAAAQLAQIDAAIAQIDAGLQQIEAAYPQLDAAQAQIDAAQAELDAGWQEFADGLEEANAEIAENEQKRADAKQELDENRQKLNDARAEFEDGQKQLDDAKKELEDGWNDYYAGQREAGEKIAEAEQELADAKVQIEDGKQELADAQQELADGEKKLADAEKEYDDGVDQLEKLRDPDVFVLDRGSNIGYACFESDSDIVRGVSRVFPLFFFAVAALVCITTMTRMVEEQRTQAGTLKALGYSSGAILSMYFLYAGSASVIGCVTGIAAGAYFLPKIIWMGYDIMYGFTDILFAFDWKLALLSSGAYLICALGATWYAIHAELAQPAAELIRPKAPKAGKRILLERIPAVWDRIPFLHKVSIRNILRYKKRMVMMAIGIGGCTALLITGYGIEDSISHVVDYQYDEITQYDASVTFQHAMTEDERAAFRAAFPDAVERSLFAAQKSFDAAANGLTKTATAVCTETGSVDGFIDLHTQDKTPVDYPQDGGVIISRGLAQALRIGAGDTITLGGELHRTDVTVAGVFENYVYNYVYMTAGTYETVFQEAPAYETAWVVLDPAVDAHAASAALAGYKKAASVSLNDDFRGRVSTMMQSLEYIVLVVVACAAALAFIVLYNLTNINITEREREIATIKVLGFYDRETNHYIFRENILLTCLGALVGLPMGKALHAYVMAQIRIDLMCFDVRIAPRSYLLAVALTIVFGLVVNLVLRRKIRAVDMAQALKSIE